jgi:hypothetical protein
VTRNEPTHHAPRTAKVVLANGKVPDASVPRTTSPIAWNGSTRCTAASQSGNRVIGRSAAATLAGLWRTALGDRVADPGEG